MCCWWLILSKEKKKTFGVFSANLYFSSYSSTSIVSLLGIVPSVCRQQSTSVNIQVFGLKEVKLFKPTKGKKETEKEKRVKFQILLRRAYCKLALEYGYTSKKSTTLGSDKSFSLMRFFILIYFLYFFTLSSLLRSRRLFFL